jgi:hypothetical protein
MSDGAMITPDTAWVVGSVVAAAIATGPAYLANRRNRRTSGELTDVLSHEFGRLHGRLDAQDAALKEVRDWQAEHTTEHAVNLLTRSRLELRRKDKP